MVLLSKIDFLATSKNILICPLDWGLGHATRCVPIIQLLQQRGHNVLVAADNAPLAFLKSTFPKLQFVKFPGFKASYSAGRHQTLHLLLSLPAALRSFSEDHKTVECMIDTYQIDGLISDNRFGAWSRKVPSVYITHQLHVQLPRALSGMHFIADKINAHYIQKHQNCWIPDVSADQGLSGLLSSNPYPQVDSHFIGPLSRFKQQHLQVHGPKEIDLLVMLSGPEPQRSVLEKIILEQIPLRTEKIVLLRGLPGNCQTIDKQFANLTVYNHVDDAKLVELVHASKKMLARSGYSTIMDLTRLQLPVIVVPTPGQTEQEYLAKYLSSKKWVKCVNQHNIDLKTILSDDSNTVLPTFNAEEKLRSALEKWLMTL